MHRFGIVILLPLLVLISACATTSRVDRIEHAPEIIDELPTIPDVDGPLDINLVYPRASATKPNADSTFLFGSVGTGEAELTINGHPVAVAPNGAFLAYIPVPRDGTYRFSAQADGETDQLVYSYRTPPPPAPRIDAFPEPRSAVVVGGRDTLATGSQIVHAYPAPGADRRWFFPPGTRLTATGRSGGLVRVRLTDRTDAWIDSASVRFDIPAEAEAEPPAADSAASSVEIVSNGRNVDVRIPSGRAPFLVQGDLRRVGIVVYGRTAPESPHPADDFVASAAWRGTSPDSAYMEIELSRPLWGYKAFFDEGGTLVVRLRKPPDVDSADPLRGLRIMVDPGHPPGGAIGPTGMTEAEANLDIALKLADMLRERGAEVIMTRTTSSGLVSDSVSAIELWARVDFAVERNADLLVSIHNNAFPDGVNPFEHFGTETYYYHPFSAPLAEALQRHLVDVTGLPSLGAKQRSLALVRPSWMPSTLTESLFMMFPQQEAALRHSGFQTYLARAHLDGILSFLRDVLQ